MKFTKKELSEFIKSELKKYMEMFPSDDIISPEDSEKFAKDRKKIKGGYHKKELPAVINREPRETLKDFLPYPQEELNDPDELTYSYRSESNKK